MRFALVAFSAAALATLAGCSSPVPATPDGAWTVNMTNSGGTCDISNSTRMLGEVTATDIEATVIDGMMSTTISCSVVGTGTGPYAVDILAEGGADTLDIHIPALSQGTTMAAPAPGSVSYESDATVAAYQGTCDFYFANAAETVGTGKVWVAFACAGLTDAASASTCPVLESYAVFENCLTVTED